MAPMKEPDVGVIGAGAAGGAAARQLLAAQIPAVVLEARPRVGGRAWTMREPSGMALDLGCGWLHSADENEWAALAPTLGLTVDPTPPPWGGRRRTIAFPPAEREDFRAASERFFARIDAAADDPVDRPAADFLEPGSRWNPLLNAVGNYISGGELGCVSARDLPAYPDTGTNLPVTEGYGGLTEAYAAPLDLRLDCPLTLIDHSRPRLLVATPRGDISARAAIVAGPASLLASEP